MNTDELHFRATEVYNLKVQQKIFFLF